MMRILCSTKDALKKIFKKNVRGVALFVQKILASKERADLAMFDGYLFALVGAECKHNSITAQKKIFAALLRER